MFYKLRDSKVLWKGCSLEFNSVYWFCLKITTFSCYGDSGIICETELCCVYMNNELF